MSGTSHDGLDIAYCLFSENTEKWDFEIQKAITLPYSTEWKERLLSLPDADQAEIQKADEDLGKYFGKKVKTFLEEHNLTPGFVASHGHTVFHEPDKGITLQIGKGEHISRECGVKVINDFRSEDVAMGGQGAPLVPVGDHYLFPEYDCCLNIGGIANISYASKGKRIAYDICPANMVLNRLAMEMGQEYDENGFNASRGEVMGNLLAELESIPYYQKKGARSLGREWVHENIFPILDNYSSLAVEDRLASVTQHIAMRIGDVIRESKGEQVLATGGGAYNLFLLSRLVEYSGANISRHSNELVEYKEAMIFAFLGLLRLKGINNVFASVTGAPHDHCAGRIIQA